MVTVAFGKGGVAASMFSGILALMCWLICWVIEWLLEELTVFCTDISVFGSELLDV